MAIGDDVIDDGDRSPDALSATRDVATAGGGGGLRPEKWRVSEVSSGVAS